MLKYSIAYATSAVIFLMLDMVWLGFIAKDFYRSQIKHLMADSFNIKAAVAFYVLYCIGLMFFAVRPALQDHDWRIALAYGAGFGFFAYLTYDLSNLATLKDYPTQFAFVDIAWGSFASAITASIATVVANKISS